jgi:hypothetical protein
MRILLLFIAFHIGCAGVSAQVYTPVFPNLTGSALYQALVAAYKPSVVLDYANARDTLFSRVYARDDDSVRCIYSAHTLYLDPTKNPRQYLYQNGGPLGISTEHAYPQSKGAGSGNARSDMHHLFPARTPVNEARSNKPFAEIPDEQTQQWFYKTFVLTAKPVIDPHLYSENNAIAFEPREAAKGDVARAVFYFYTMYTAEALGADPNFFEQQRPTLCQWHYEDRADSAELVRTWRIAPYQQNKPNPFILDCTVARRLYCPDLPNNCQTVAVVSAPERSALELRFSPNPWSGGGQGRVVLWLPEDGQVRLRLLSLLGQELAVWPVCEATAGEFAQSVEWPTTLTPGLVVLEATLLQGGLPLYRAAAPVVIQP